MKRVATILVFLVIILVVVSTGAQTDRLFLKSSEDYSEIQKLQIQITCLRIELQERERIKEFQFHQLAQEINRLQNPANKKERPGIDLSSLDVFNYSLASIIFDEDEQVVVVSILANQRFIDQKTEVERKKFLSDCFRLISQKLAKSFIDYDEYRDLVVKFYPLDYETEPFAEYQEGGYIWAPSK